MKCKKCYKCKELKSIENFHTDNTRKDKLSGKCKKCKNLVDKEYSKKRRAKRKNLRKNKIKFEDYNKRRRELHRIDPTKRLWGGAKRRAKRKGIEFNILTYKSLPKVPKYCPILGIPLKVGKEKGSNGGGTDNSPSLDRINNNKGYTIDNIQIISRKANQMKSNATLKEIEKLYNYMSRIINKR